MKSTSAEVSAPGLRVNAPKTDVARYLEEENRTVAVSLKLLSSVIDSPQTLQILRNTLLLELETNDEKEDDLRIERAAMLLSDSELRAGAIEKLIAKTPKIWSEDWNSAWRKDAEPLYSHGQQYLAMRAALITFWTKEWREMPEELKTHVASLVLKTTRKKQ